MRTSRPKRSWAAALGAAVWLLDCALVPAGGAWAQRKDEPTANPQFPSQAPAPNPDAGSPVANPAGGPSDSAAGAAPGGGEESPFPNRNLQAVQIGPAIPRRPPPDVPTNPLETRIVVRVKNAPLATFLDTISAQAKVNFIITEGLEEKRVTAFLQNVTVREALQILLEIKGLTYQRIGKSNTYVVSPRSKDVPNRITRIYTLSFIPLVPIAPGPPNLNVQSVQSPGAMDQSQAQSQQQAFQQQPQGQPGQAGVGPLSTATEGPVAIVNVLRSVLTPQYGKIAIDARTNAVIITDLPEVFPQVEQILAELDRKAPQVIIEAQIVEIDSDRAHQLGIEWGGPNGELATYTGPKRDTTFPLNLPAALSNAHFFDPVTSGASTLIISGIGGQGGTAGGGSGTGTSGGTVINSLVLQSGILDLTQLKVLLKALVTRSEARFLGKPKIMTLNNKAAAIKISSPQAVSVNTTAAGTGGLNSISSTIERQETGLKLEVTPQVNREGFITLLILPSFTDVVESQVSSSTQRVFDSRVRAAGTLVRVKNGQTLVLGGLLQSTESKQVRKVPFLGYIPVLGWLFTSTSSTRKNTDLVIFITPTVVND